MRIAAALLVTLWAGGEAAAQGLAPGTTYDPSIPTLKAVAGHDPGDAITTPDEIGRYLDALVKAAPDRTRLVKYATSWEGRPLHYLIVGSPDRIARLDDVRRGLQQLGAAAPDGEKLMASLPVVVWLLHGIHGNEISSADAALQEAYHVLAARGNADVDLILRESLLLIDPMENPDGRARFVTTNLLGRAADPDPEPLSAEHDEPWPGGRSNHYLFDMNRDYFAVSQPETLGRVRTMLEWFPQVVVDLHEMSGNSTYYFAPPADPINPHVTDAQKKWFDVFGRANAAAFDRRGFAYFSREVYDSFYPGYGESWPIFHGAIGMTYEQASPRGLSFRREDDSTLTYKDAVTHHFTSAITTAVTAARNRERLLRDFYEFRRSAMSLRDTTTKEYLIPPGADPSRALQLGRLLQLQGIQVRVADEPFTAGARSLPRGTLIVPLAQPSARLLRNLLDPDIKMDDRFLKEQDRRRRERLPDQIYDVTAWSLALVYDVDVVPSDRPSPVRASDLKPDSTASVQIAEGTVGVLIPWGTGGARAVADALRRGIRVHFADDTFTQGGRRFAIGTAFVRLSENPQLTPQVLSELASRYDAEIVPIRETWTEEGLSLGSSRVAHLRAPRILLAWDTPTSSLSAGWARFALERHLGARVTAMRVSSLQNFDMKNYDVLVLPSGSYTLGEEPLRRVRDWVRNGGTLITIGEASRWAARDRNNLLATDTLMRDGAPERDEPAAAGSQPAGAKPDTSKPFDYDKAIQPDRERPELLAGAVLRVSLDRNHWLTAGLDAEIQAVVEGDRVFAPLKLDAGRNVGVYAPADKLVAAGLVWKEAQPLLAQRAFLMHQPMGRGHIIAFAEDPNYRAFTAATELLFFNAVLLGPSH
jgi:zinc carboxypeptidase